MNLETADQLIAEQTKRCEAFIMRNLTGATTDRQCEAYEKAQAVVLAKLPTCGMYPLFEEDERDIFNALPTDQQLGRMDTDDMCLWMAFERGYEAIAELSDQPHSTLLFAVPFVQGDTLLRCAMLLGLLYHHRQELVEAYTDLEKVS